ncbi:hypothetical protein B0H13DRAFT_1891778 [Mycena leptocephala]|nr:hypothetical protein B0H13DRAFT_1891778 [Mycena leptocephala]
MSLALITKPSRAYSQLTVDCEPFAGHPPKIDCSQFFPAFCGSISDEIVPPGEGIPTDLGCLEDQSLGASCNIGGVNDATTPQVPSKKICLEALTAVNNTCIGSFGFARAKEDGFRYATQPLPFVCSQLTVNCEPSGQPPKIDCSQFFSAFCGSIGDEPVPPGEDIPTDLGCLEDQSLGASCNIGGGNGATTPQVPSKKICLEALTAVNNTCIGSFGFAQAKGDGFTYNTQPLPFVCKCSTSSEYHVYSCQAIRELRIFVFYMMLNLEVTGRELRGLGGRLRQYFTNQLSEKSAHSAVMVGQWASDLDLIAVDEFESQLAEGWTRKKKQRVPNAAEAQGSSKVIVVEDTSL